MTNGSDKTRSRCLSGMRPTGKLHLGNYVGALKNWVGLQDSHECFFFVADWHALTTDYDDTSRLADNTLEVILDYLAAGLDPQKCTIFVQSHVLEHAELHLLFSMITPLGWLERVPTYKEQQQNMPNKDLHMYGFLGYPVLQAADILIYRPDFVPVGEDQASHVELTREVARRFNHLYLFKGKPVFPEPEVLLTPSPKLLGTDKRKMSKSYGNSILLSEEAAQLSEKIKNSVTDRPKLTDRGSPDRCPVGNLHQIFSDANTLAYITEGCTQATITCVECKELAFKTVNSHLEPIRNRRRELEEKPERLQEVIRQGDEKAAKNAEETMVRVREAVGLLSATSVSKISSQDIHASVWKAPEPARTSSQPEWTSILIDDWVERISKTFALRKDRPGVFITRKGRKVGVHAAKRNESGGWTFSFRDRPVNVIVLLVANGNEYEDYVLPPKFLQENWSQFEREKAVQGDTVLIHARRHAGNGLFLHLESNNTPVNVAIENYRGNHSALE